MATTGSSDREVTAGAHRDRRRGIPPLAQFATVALVVLIGVIIALSIAAGGARTRAAVAESERVTSALTHAAVVPALDDGLLAGNPAAVAALDDSVKRRVLDDHSIVRVKLWDDDGRILYSDSTALIGQTFVLKDDALAVFRTGQPSAEVANLTDSENVLEQEFGELLEVYAPVSLPGGHHVVFEVYYRYGAVSAGARRVWTSFAPLAIGSLVLLQFVQLPLAARLSRRLREGQRQREQLLQRVIDAADTERRQVASDLHDGVVQNLLGVSYSLSATAVAARAQSSPYAEPIADAATSLRDDIKALRSLMVEIYPPKLDDEGLDAAIVELLSRLETQGIATLATIDPALDLSSVTSRLLFRVVQEAVRNVLKHADATAVSVTIKPFGNLAALTVDDDGRGIEAHDLSSAVGQGHVGLHVLAGLITDAGGSLTIHAGPTGGTRVRAEVPL
jgi:signal transduction histidine kinase